MKKKVRNSRGTRMSIIIGSPMMGTYKDPDDKPSNVTHYDWNSQHRPTPNNSVEHILSKFHCVFLMNDERNTRRQNQWRKTKSTFVHRLVVMTVDRETKVSFTIDRLNKLK